MVRLKNKLTNFELKNARLVNSTYMKLLNIKLTNLPDNIDLHSVNIVIITQKLKLAIKSHARLNPVKFVRYIHKQNF